MTNQSSPGTEYTQALAKAGLRHAEEISARLAKPEWKPSRAQIEQARNSIKKLSELLLTPAQSGVMRSADKALETVASWSSSKQAYAARVTGAGVAQAQSSDRITQAIRDYCISLGSPVQLSSDGVERIYYSGISIVGLADAILANAAPANRSTAKATANVGDNGERMGSEPAMGIVTGGSDPTPSMMPSTTRRACHDHPTKRCTPDDCCQSVSSNNQREGK